MEKTLFSAKSDAMCQLLVKLREAAGLTQRQLAARLRCTQSWVAKTETAERRLDVVELVEVLKALRVRPQEAAVRIVEVILGAGRKPKRSKG